MKKFTAALSGTVIEYYDYALYGFAAVSLSQHFFPTDDPTTALLKSFLVFALGSFAKPAGAFFFSHIGDHKGRVVVLRWSMLGIALPTCIIGLLPTYCYWGWVSTLILVLCRFFQGFLLSGEYDGVAIYIQEHISQKYACLGNCLLGSCSFLGIYLASFMLSLSQTWLPEPWSWRIPFILGGAFGFICLILRRQLQESPQFKEEKQQPQPMAKLVRTHWPAILATILLCGSVGAIYHFVFIFWPTYLQGVIGVWGDYNPFLVSHGLLLLILCCPIAGYFADRIGAEKAFIFGTLLVTSVLLSILINAAFGLYPTFLFNTLVVTLPFFMSSGHVLLARYIGVKERYRCINIGHAIGSLIFSGTTPAFALLIWQKTHIETLPLLYVLCFPGLALVGFALLKGRDRKDILSAIQPGLDRI